MINQTPLSLQKKTNKNHKYNSNCNNTRKHINEIAQQKSSVQYFIKFALNILCLFFLKQTYYSDDILSLPDVL